MSQLSAAYGIPVWQWARKKWWYAFKPTEEVPVCHTGPYRLTSSPGSALERQRPTLRTASKRSNFWTRPSFWRHLAPVIILQKAQLSQTDGAVFRVIEYFANIIKLIRNDTHCKCLCISYRFWDMQRQIMAGTLHMGRSRSSKTALFIDRSRLSIGLSL